MTHHACINLSEDSCAFIQVALSSWASVSLAHSEKGGLTGAQTAGGQWNERDGILGLDRSQGFELANSSLAP